MIVSQFENTIPRFLENLKLEYPILGQSYKEFSTHILTYDRKEIKKTSCDIFMTIILPEVPYYVIYLKI
jgi:hypothetical protein